MAAVDRGKEGESVADLSLTRTKVRTSEPSDGLDIARELSGLASEEPLTVGTMIQQTVSRVPDHVALCYKTGEVWKNITYQQYYNLCIAAAKSFTRLGLKPFHAVVIIGFNSAEWHISALGAVFAGGLSCGIYATNDAEACQLIAVDCRAQVAVVEDQKQLDKILLIREQLPELKAIVQYKGKLSKNSPNVYDWEQFLELGSDMETSEIEDRIKSQKPNQCAALVYTSGTTGKPKGVMLSHDNLTWSAKSMMKTYTEIKFATEHSIGYLPLSHIAAQMADIYLAITAAATIHFAQPDALKGSLRDTISEVQPTMFFGVPRVYERIVERMKEISASMTGLKKVISEWAMRKGLQGNQNRQNNQPLPWGWTFAEFLLFKKVRRALGFQRCKIFAVGGTSTQLETYEFLMSLNIPMMNFYGMSESSGPHCLNRMFRDHWKVGSAGKNINGVRTKLDHPDAKGEGEVCFYGRHVFMGYLGNEGKTGETIDKEGWLHTGDIGKFDKNGFLYVTGRIKEIIILSGGQIIQPITIESNILREIPFLSHAVVVGDKREYPVCLMTLKCVVDTETGEPTDMLTPLARRMIESLGSQCTTVSSVVHSRDEAVFAAITQGMERANLHSPSAEQRIQKWDLLDKDFSIPGGELSPTLKIRRFFVHQKYSHTIETLYQN